MSPGGHGHIISEHKCGTVAVESSSVNATGVLPFPAAPYSPCMHAEWRSGETVQMSHGETPRQEYRIRVGHVE